MKITYPPSPKSGVVDIYHGTAVPDPYRWLEDPDSPETKAWGNAQNQLTRDFIEELPNWQPIEARLKILWNYPKRSVPRKKGDHYYSLLNDGLQNQAVLYAQDTLDGPTEPVLDPNTLSDDGTVALTTQSYSKNGRYLAYGLSESGSDWQTIHVRDLESDQTLDEVTRWTKFGGVAWHPDATGFYYARYPAPGEIPDAAPSTHQRVYFHKLGTTQEEDELIYARPDAPNLGFFPQVTEDGRYLLLTVWDGTDRRRRFYYRPLNSEGAFIRLLDEFDAMYLFLGNDEGVFYFQTDLEAENGRLIAINTANNEQRELIAEQADPIAFALIANNQFALVRLHNAHHQLHIHALDGTYSHQIELPTIGSILEIEGQREESDLFINFQSFLYPPTILHYSFDHDSPTLNVLHQPTLDFDPTDYETTQHFTTSRDGTQVPVFLTHKRGLKRDGNNPTLLYGYGGFNVSLPPLFSPTRLLWLEQGGIYAQATLRGGGEFGKAWHLAGILENKQNVFDDFIGAAEWLIANDYTRPDKLAIEGKSNGGLLVAATMLQRPDLFGAIHCGVPVIDMLRYHLFTAGRYWTSEYGNAVENGDEFNFMHQYSPLHNVKEGVVYPPLLITTADTDDRVVPMHAKKFAATVQTAVSPHQQANPALIRIETAAGHGQGKPISKQIEEAADVYSFLLAMLQ
ncbi:MAG: prolyl oligopeptidase family serine peptidase [Chloroflexota bacterium]